MKRELTIPEKLLPMLSPMRHKIIRGGRGSAKSWSAARALLALGIMSKRRILCVREIMRTIDESVHHLLATQIQALDLGANYRVQDRAITGIYGRGLGTEFLFEGLRDQDAVKLKSFEDVDIAWVEEGQTVRKKSWQIFTPTIRKPGSEIWVTFNPDLDTDDTYTRWVVHPPPQTWAVHVTYRDNPWFSPELELERAHCKATEPEDEYNNIWEGQPRIVLPGAIYAKEVMALMAGNRYRPMAYDPMLPVHTVWDLGWNDQAAIILVQVFLNQAIIIGYIEDSQRMTSDYVDQLKAMPCRWGDDWIPHDGFHGNMNTGKLMTTEKILKKLGRRPREIPRMGVEEGIKATRMLFPKLYVNSNEASGCGRLMECLRRYRRNIPTTTNEPASPVHDEYSHGADALRGLGVCINFIRNESSGEDKNVPHRKILDPGMAY